MPALLLATLLAAAPWSAPDDAHLGALLTEVRPLPLRERLAAISERFVGAPYLLGPLGEGPGASPDPDPLWRWDAVDCVTFVEEMLALAESRTVREAEQRLQALRYRGETVAFEERNHLMESGWIPSNAAKGLVREATREIAGRDLRYLWRRAAPRDGLEREVALGYLPLDRALAHARDVPSGTLFFVARTWGHRVTDHVSHVGLLIRKNGQLFARHAASGRGRVIDQPFAQFLDAERRSFPAYPVVGLELVEPLETQTR